MINVVNIFEGNVGPITRAARLSSRLVTAAVLQEAWCSDYSAGGTLHS